MDIGYARVSSVGQSLEVQLGKLSHCEKIFQEKISGSSRDRGQLEACIGFVREGDRLFVTRLDRLARSTLHLCQIAEELERKRVGLCVIDQAIDTGTATGRLLFNVLAAIAQFENELRRERQVDGIAKARDLGRNLGRPRQLTDQQIAELRAKRATHSVGQLCREYGLSKSSIYRYLERKLP